MQKMKLNKRKPAYLLALLLTASVLPIAAQAEADALVKDALALTQTGQSAQAFQMLEPLEAQRAGDPDFDTVFGIAANETGQYTRAIFALERVLAVQPENTRARAELGRALFGVGDNRAARRLLQETKTQGIPVEAAKTIDQFLQAIDRIDEAGRSSIKGYVEATVGHDSNVNSGPVNPNVAVPVLGNIVVVLTPAGVKTKASFASAGGGVSGRYIIDPRWSIIGNATANIRANGNGTSQFDSSQIDLTGGAAYRVERNEYSVVGQVGTYTIDGSRARDQYGLVGEWTYRFDGFRQFTSYLQLSKLKYPNQPIRDADRDVLGTTYAHLFRNGILAYGGVYVGAERENAAGRPDLGHKLTGLRAGVQKPFNETLAAFVTLGYENRRYGGTDPIFLVGRRDHQTNLNVGLSWLPARGWRITPQIAYTNTNSNVVIADYARTVVSITARKEF
jgi:tetratricopeptide (TPR) repeat protein